VRPTGVRLLDPFTSGVGEGNTAPSE
jgi:hypothetical protein